MLSALPAADMAVSVPEATQSFKSCNRSSTEIDADAAHASLNVATLADTSSATTAARKRLPTSYERVLAACGVPALAAKVRRQDAATGDLLALAIIAQASANRRPVVRETRCMMCSRNIRKIGAEGLYQDGTTEGVKMDECLNLNGLHHLVALE
jgi:hypothetical protein